METIQIIKADFNGMKFSSFFDISQGEKGDFIMNVYNKVKEFEALPKTRDFWERIPEEARALMTGELYRLPEYNGMIVKSWSTTPRMYDPSSGTGGNGSQNVIQVLSCLIQVAKKYDNWREMWLTPTGSPCPKPIGSKRDPIIEVVENFKTFEVIETFECLFEYRPVSMGHGFSDRY